MGMFDRVRFEIDLGFDHGIVGEDDWQTKDLENRLATVTIKKDGSVWMLDECWDDEELPEPEKVEGTQTFRVSKYKVPFDMQVVMVNDEVVCVYRTDSGRVLYRATTPSTAAHLKALSECMPYVTAQVRMAIEWDVGLFEGSKYRIKRTAKDRFALFKDEELQGEHDSFEKAYEAYTERVEMRFYR